jgi:hypothetical protein
MRKFQVGRSTRYQLTNCYTIVLHVVISTYPDICSLRQFACDIVFQRNDYENKVLHKSQITGRMKVHLGLPANSQEPTGLLFRYWQLNQMCNVLF